MSSENHSCASPHEITPFAASEVVPSAVVVDYYGREQRFQMAFEHAAVGMSITSPDGRWMQVNRALSAALGYAREELVARTFVSVTHPDDIALNEALFTRALNGELDRYHMEKRYIHKNGTIVWMHLHVVLVRDEHGLPLYFLSQMQDISRRKLAESLLKESEARYRQLVELSPDAIMVSKCDVFCYANPATARLLGVQSPEELIGLPVADVVQPELRAHIRDRLANAKDGTQLPLEEFELRRPDGSRLQLEAACVRTTFANEPATQIIVRDVSERTRAKRKLRQLEEQLRQSQKMEAVGQLASGVAHDFNNLLMVIDGHAEVALEEIHDAKPLATILSEIRRAVSRASSLTQQLLAFGRRQLLQPTVIDLNRIIGGLEPMLRRLIASHICVRAELTRGLGAVRADKGQLEQVIINLAVNARDAMPDGGALVISTSNATITERDNALPLPPGEYAVITVSDTGQGMDRETCKRIFEPFFTTKAPGKGTGLGLSTVYGIISQSGGHVGVSSRVGEGTTFTIHLPRVAAETAARPTAPLLDPKHSGNESVLLVEDEEPVQRLLSRVLTQRGYTVLNARNGQDAIQMITSVDVDVVISDMMLPDMSGVELVEKLQQLRPGVPAVFMSGYAHTDLPTSGDSRFLQKPFSNAALATAVRASIDERVAKDLLQQSSNEHSLR